MKTPFYENSLYKNRLYGNSSYQNSIYENRLYEHSLYENRLYEDRVYVNSLYILPICHCCCEPILPQPVHHDITGEIVFPCCVWLLAKHLPGLPLYGVFLINHHLADPLHNPTYFQWTRCCPSS